MEDKFFENIKDKMNRPPEFPFHENSWEDMENKLDGENPSKMMGWSLIGVFVLGLSALVLWQYQSPKDVVHDKAKPIHVESDLDELDDGVVNVGNESQADINKRSSLQNNMDDISNSIEIMESENIAQPLQNIKEDIFMKSTEKEASDDVVTNTFEIEQLESRPSQEIQHTDDATKPSGQKLLPIKIDASEIVEKDKDEEEEELIKILELENDDAEMEWEEPVDDWD